MKRCNEDIIKHHKPYRVFGIGLNKTGTSTLKIAMQQIGYNHYPRNHRMYKEYREGNLERIFDEISTYNSFDDWPWPLMYKELFWHYGDAARFVLTYRSSPAVWVESLKRHADITPYSKIRKTVYGHCHPRGHEAEHEKIYRDHLNEVRRFFASQNAEDQLLACCWEDGLGWIQLCSFLQEPLPSAIFPHANKSIVNFGC